jgi:hypothetical protein
MAKLTRKDRRVLELTGNGVRMYVALISFVFPLWAAVKASQQYRLIDLAGREPEVARAATYGTIVGIYMPMFAAVAAYIWATRAYPAREMAPHGFGMALFRDLFTVLVLTALLYLPVGLYGSYTHISGVHTLLIWYQTVITAGAGGAFAYYFHASLETRGKRWDAGTPRRARAQPANSAASDAPASR